MAPPGSSRESLLHRALPVYFGLLLAILTVVSVLLLFMVRHVLLVLFVSVLFAAALTEDTIGSSPDGTDRAR